MLKFLGLLLIGCGFASTVLASTIPEYLKVDQTPGQYRKHGIIPIPWGMEQPFPWKSVDGLWRATIVQKNEIVSNFEFKVVREEATGVRQLSIREVNLDTGVVVAEGVGRQKGEAVEAQMTTKQGVVYLVKIGSFNTKDYPVKVDPNQYVTNNSILLMSAALLDHPFSMTHLCLSRIYISDF